MANNECKYTKLTFKKPRFTTIDNSSPLIDIYQPNIIRNTKGIGMFKNAVWFVKGLLEYTKSGY